MREFSTKIDVRQSWTSLTASQKHAWNVLGVEGATMWNHGSWGAVWGCNFNGLHEIIYCIFFCIVIRLFLRTWADVKHVESDNDCSDMLRPRKGLSHPDRSVKVPKFKRFDKLTAAQQAAVRHGLDLDVATWDAWAVGECKSQLDSAPVGHAELVESRDVARSGLADWLLSH